MTEPRSPLVELTLARLRSFLREPSAIFWTFGFPLLLTLALGGAFQRRRPEPVRVAVEAGPAAAPLVEALGKSDGVRVELLAPDDAARALRIGKVAVVVRPGAPLTYALDATRPESRLARAVVDDALQRAAGRADPLASRDQVVTEPGSRYVDFLVPGLIGMSVMSSGMWGIGYLIVEMRTRQLIKRLVATPMRRWQFLLSFILLRMLVLLVEMPILLGFARLLFGVRMSGSAALFGALVALGALTFAGLGLLVASRAENAQTATGLMNLIQLPMFIGSGVFFSTENFPGWAQPALHALPLTALIDSLRAVMNEGAGLAGVWRPALLLVGLCAVAFAIALRVFKWR